MALDMASVKSQSAEPFVAEVGNSRSTLHNVGGPQPGQAAESRFQAAGPVNAYRIGVFCPPVPPLPQHLVGKAAIACQSVGLGQRDQVLMAIQFPRDLAVPDLRKIQIMNLVKRLSRSSFSVNGVEMPVDRTAEIKALVP